MYEDQEAFEAMVYTSGIIPALEAEVSRRPIASYSSVRERLGGVRAYPHPDFLPSWNPAGGL